MQPREHQSQWNSRSIGSNLQYNIFYALIRLGGQKAAYGLLYVVALYYILFRPTIRKKADDYLERRFEAKIFFKKRLNSLRIYVNFGKVLIDKAVIGIKGQGQIKMAFDDRVAMRELACGGQGLLILTAHVGSWQAAMSALHFLDKPVNLLLHNEEGDVDLQYFELAGGPLPFHIIDPLSYMGGVLEMLEVLKKGEVLCIMGDRVLGDKKNTVLINFLGGRVRFPISAFRLAEATGAPIAVLFSYKSGTDSCRVFLDRVIRIPKGPARSILKLQPFVAQFAEALEGYVRHYPFQFFNFYNMWEEDLEGTKIKED